MFWNYSIKEICKKLIKNRHKAYFFTSSVRNLILKQKTSLYYILTTADLVELSGMFDVTFPGKTSYDAEFKKENFIVRFKSFSWPSGGDIFKLFKEKSLNELFAFQTLYFDIEKEIFLDPWDSYYSYRNKKIMVTQSFEKIYRENSYKIFDGLYMASEYGFTITGEVCHILENTKFIINKGQEEDILRGISQVLTSLNPYIAVQFMDRFNILTEIFPEFLPAKSVEQDKDHHPEGNVYEHILECFKHVKKPSLPLAMGILFHDIGKPETATFKKNLSFPDHSYAGAKITEKILKRLGFQEDIIEDTLFLIKNHHLTYIFNKSNNSKKLELMKNRRFSDLLKLYRADILSCYGDISDYRKFSKIYRKSYGK